MARLPKFLNIPAARRVRLELPAAKTALIAFSAALVVAGVGVFAATLPSLTAGEVPFLGAVTSEAEDAITTDAVEQTAPEEAATTDAADQGAVSAGSSAVAGGVAGPSSHSARGGSASGSAGGSGDNTDAGSNASSGSSSSGGGSSSSSSSGSGSNSGGSSSSSDNVFEAVPTDADEQDFHSFLSGWYNSLGDYEAQAEAGDSSGCWSGYIAVRDHFRSNKSRWCDAHGNLIGAYRCLASWADSGEDTYWEQYQSYKSAVSL